jgi:osmotically-inducible protein OsmY
MKQDTATDRKIQREVESELQCSPDVEAARIGVSVENHAVTLTGTVSSFPERMAARRAAQRVKGVSAVADELTVHYAGAALTDSDIAQSISHVLEASAVIPGGSVKASVRNHTVTLTGSVPWNFQRDAAVRAVGAIAGVGYVENHITLPVRPSREALAEKIKDALARNAALAAQEVHIDIDDDQVTLSGHLPTWLEKKQAGLVAWSSPGVRAVRNNITVGTE